MSSTSTTALTDNEREALVRWYFETFIPGPERGYDQMNPANHTAKYSRKNDPLSPELLRRSLDDLPRRLKTDHGWISVPLSLAVVPCHRDGWARSACIDIDSGGSDAIRHALDVCAHHGLWAFAQLSTSTSHSGGHLYIPTRTPQPGSLLSDLAMRIQAAAQVAGEAYPLRKDQSLRLPLMPHLRAPGGPRRWPLLLQSGVEISVDHPWQALAALQTAWQPNDDVALTAALISLPVLAVDRPTRTHKSRVSPLKTQSVIGWYNTEHSVRELLADAGAEGSGAVVRCPYHHDRDPSLAIWRHHERGHEVCHCFSGESNCVLAKGPYSDAFNLYCLRESLTAPEAVRDLVEQHQLGEKRTLKISPVSRAQIQSVDEHRALITAARRQLSCTLETAASRPAHVTVIRATPGLGKTHAAVELAQRLHAAGKRVAIAAPSHAHAEGEWAHLLGDQAYVWQPRSATCTCYPVGVAERLNAQGYALEECRPTCPYAEQFTIRQGRITIYQHNHLHLGGGELLDGLDVLVVDESPLNALLTEGQATPHELTSLARRLATAGDPGARLADALVAIQGQGLQEGVTLMDRLRAHLGDRLCDTITAAQQAPSVQRLQRARRDADPTTLPRQFWGDLVKALAHDVTHPNTLVDLSGVWTWYRRHAFLSAAYDAPQRPAVIVLDGSANERVAERLYAPWPVEVVSIDVPLSPTVELVQCGVTASTRRIINDQRRLESLVRSVAGVCVRLDVTLDGGVSYKDAVPLFQEKLGGNWLHYGGQRGRNDLKGARAIAVVASPTAPPDAIYRKAMALWSDDETRIDREWRREGTAAYGALDPRHDAMIRLHGLEELCQAAHRCRPILAVEPTTLLVFSPWDLSEIALDPTMIVDEVPYGNSVESRRAYAAYAELRRAREGKAAA